MLPRAVGERRTKEIMGPHAWSRGETRDTNWGAILAHDHAAYGIRAATPPRKRPIICSRSAMPRAESGIASGIEEGSFAAWAIGTAAAQRIEPVAGFDHERLIQRHPGRYGE